MNFNSEQFSYKKWKVQNKLTNKIKAIWKDFITKSTRQSGKIITVCSLAAMQRPKLFAVMAPAIMSISPIPLRIQPSAMKRVRNTNTQTWREMHLPVLGLTGAVVVLGVLVGWLLKKGKRAKGTCWHNTFTNNCLLLLAPQGKHFMEITGYEGQRCEKATGKISFLDSPTMSYQLRTISACGASPWLQGSYALSCLHSCIEWRWIFKNKNFYKVTVKWLNNLCKSVLCFTLSQHAHS